jgi:D-cysteine desulfhydrase
VGKAVFRLDNWRVVGIPVSDSVEYFRQEVRSLADKTAEEYGLDALTRERIEIELIDGFIGEGYAIPYDQCIDTIKIMARREGVIMDPTYTGKGMTGMLETIRKGGIREGAVPLFIHTGGAFGLLARKDLFV